MSEEIRAELDARKAFADEDPDAPFAMVNFLRFKPGGGSKEYGKYGSAFSKLLRSYGGEFIYSGRVVRRFVGDDDWHTVAVVHYPSCRAFYALTTSDEYAKIHEHREEGLEKTLVYAIAPVDRAQAGLE